MTVSVLWLFFTVPCAGLQSVIVLFLIILPYFLRYDFIVVPIITSVNIKCRFTRLPTIYFEFHLSSGTVQATKQFLLNELYLLKG